LGVEKKPQSAAFCTCCYPPPLPFGGSMACKFFIQDTTDAEHHMDFICGHHLDKQKKISTSFVDSYVTPNRGWLLS